MKQLSNQSPRGGSRQSNMIVIEGEIVALSQKAVKFSQRLCFCGNSPDCQCPEKSVWIPKSLIKRSCLYDPKLRLSAESGFHLWQLGSACLLIPGWKFREIYGKSELGLRD